MSRKIAVKKFFEDDNDKEEIIGIIEESIINIQKDSRNLEYFSSLIDLESSLAKQSNIKYKLDLVEEEDLELLNFNRQVNKKERIATYPKLLDFISAHTEELKKEASTQQIKSENPKKSISKTNENNADLYFTESEQEISFFDQDIDIPKIEISKNATIEEILKEYDFDEKEIMDITKQLDQNIDLTNAKQILEFFKKNDFLEAEKIRKEMVKIISNCEYRTLYQMKRLLESYNYNSKAIIESASSILFSSDLYAVKNIIDILKSKNLNAENIIFKCKNIFSLTNKNKIKKTINVLEENGIDIKIIEQCTILLIRNSAEEMDKIITWLKKETSLNYVTMIECCPSILSHSKVKNIKELKKILNDNFENVIKAHPYVLAIKDVTTVADIQEVLGNLFDEIILKEPTILLKVKATEIEKIKNLLGDSFESLVKDYPKIILNLTAEQIKTLKDKYGNDVEQQIRNYFSSSKKTENFTQQKSTKKITSKIKERTLAIAEEKKIYDIKEILGNQYDEIVKANPQILEIHNPNKIKNIIKALGNNSQAFFIIKNNPSILTKASEKNIINLRNILKDKFYEIVINCPTVLNRANPKRIENISKKLGDSFIPLVTNCPSIIGFATEEKINRLETILGPIFQKTIAKTPTILCLQNSDIDNFEKIKDELKENFYDLVSLDCRILTKGNPADIHSIKEALENSLGNSWIEIVKKETEILFKINEKKIKDMQTLLKDNFQLIVTQFPKILLLNDIEEILDCKKKYEIKKSQNNKR